jgi:hypothetical protein
MVPSFPSLPLPVSWRFVAWDAPTPDPILWSKGAAMVTPTKATRTCVEKRVAAARRKRQWRTQGGRRARLPECKCKQAHVLWCCWRVRGGTVIQWLCASVWKGGDSRKERKRREQRLTRLLGNKCVSDIYIFICVCVSMHHSMPLVKVTLVGLRSSFCPPSRFYIWLSAKSIAACSTRVVLATPNEPRVQQKQPWDVASSC